MDNTIKIWVKKFLVNNDITIDNLANDVFHCTKTNIYTKIANESLRLKDIITICNHYNIELNYTRK